MKLAQELGKLLSEAARSDQRIVVLDGDLADSDGAESFALEHPTRFYMAGISEQNMVSVAAGMAAEGLRPFVFSFAAFLCFRAYDQIRIGMSQAAQPVVLVGSHAGGLTGPNGKTHAAVNDVALVGSLPRLEVWTPTDKADLQYCLRRALAGRSPAYIRLPRVEYEPSWELKSQQSENRWIAEAASITIVTAGLATQWAVEALKDTGVILDRIGHLHCCQLSLSRDTLQKLKQADVIVTIEDHYVSGGLGDLVRGCLPHQKIISLGWPENFEGRQGRYDQIREAHGLSKQNIIDRLSEIRSIRRK